MVQARISGMISTDICQDCNNADIRLDSFILGNIADSGMITFGCVVVALRKYLAHRFLPTMINRC